MCNLLIVYPEKLSKFVRISPTLYPRLFVS